MRRHIILGTLCLTLTLGSLLTGCGSKNTTTSESNAFSTTEDTNLDTSDDTNSRGIIESIDTDKNTITISVMGGAPHQGGDSSQQPPQNGERPEMPENGEKGERPEMPENGEKPDGQMPSGESKTYNITDSTEIKDQNDNTITIDELAQNDFIEIEVDGDNILSIKKSESPGKPGSSDQAPDGMTGASAEETSEQ